MPDFTLSLPVRADDLDVNGHLRSSAYVAYADHARWEWVRAAGVTVAAMHAARIGPVTLETTIRFRHEVRAGDTVRIDCVPDWSGTRVTRVAQRIVRGDGELAAEIESSGGMFDLDRRRLLDDAAQAWRSLAVDPEVMGL